MLGLVVNDSVSAAIIGVSFTSVLALMAWIVRTLATTTGELRELGHRIGRLEDHAWPRRAS